MSSKDVWGKANRDLTLSLVLSLKELDVADRSGNVVYDGSFAGVDLIRFGEYADRYAKACTKDNPSLEKIIYSGTIRIIHSILGVANYAKQLSEQGQENARVLELAMFEAATAMFEGREPLVRKIIGFEKRFIDVEFLNYFKQIFAGDPTERTRWDGFWRKLLAGCHIDMFLNHEHCEFN